MSAEWNHCSTCHDSYERPHAGIQGTILALFLIRSIRWGLENAIDNVAFTIRGIRLPKAASRYNSKRTLRVCTQVMLHKRFPGRDRYGRVANKKADIIVSFGYASEYEQGMESTMIHARVYQTFQRHSLLTRFGTEGCQAC